MVFALAVIQFSDPCVLSDLISNYGFMPAPCSNSAITIVINYSCAFPTMKEIRSFPRQSKVLEIATYTWVGNKKKCVYVFQYFTHHQRLKAWDGLGDKLDLLLYCAPHLPTPAQLGFQLVDNLSMSPPEG